MLSIDVSHARPFLSYPYEEVLRPRLERAQRELLSGGGKGGDFTGWVALPRDYDKAEFARLAHGLLDEQLPLPDDSGIELRVDDARAVAEERRA